VGWINHIRERRWGLAAPPLLALGLLASPAVASSTDWTQLRAMNIAHQGGEDEAPSNTMYAYERALRLGADMLEVDIHTSAEGELVVLHDATVDRTTNGSGSVYEMTLEEIQALDAGHNLVPGEGTVSGVPASDYPFRGVRTGRRKPPRRFEPADFRIPTLEEVMRVYPDVPINIEIKGAADSDVASFLRNAEALAAFLNETGRTEGVIVASFNDLALERFHELAPAIDLAPGVAGVAGYKLGGVPPPPGTAAFQVPIEFSGITVVDPPFVTRAHGDGYAVHVWTINDEPTMNELLEWGVDGVMTAQPIRLESVLCARDAERPQRPSSAPGRHCSERASIACTVEPVRAKLRGKRLRVKLLRRDEFVGRCAGRLKVRAAGTRVRQFARFDFGDTPPSEGGPHKRLAELELTRRLRQAAHRDRTVKLTARPYLAFREHATLAIR
jgi:glycerophosphoryl diester phosphodiesterase